MSPRHLREQGDDRVNHADILLVRLVAHPPVVKQLCTTVNQIEVWMARVPGRDNEHGGVRDQQLQAIAGCPPARLDVGGDLRFLGQVGQDAENVPPCLLQPLVVNEIIAPGSYGRMLRVRRAIPVSPPSVVSSSMSSSIPSTFTSSETVAVRAALSAEAKSLNSRITWPR